MPAQKTYKSRLTRCLTLTLLGSVATCSWAAPDPWAELLQQDARLASQVRWLETGAERGLYLYQANEAAKQRGIVLLLHDLHAHADWPRLIGPLRRALPEHGWSTWSLQLPTPPSERDNEAYVQAVGARLAAALSAAAEQSDSPLLLVGAGTGASAALQFLSLNPDPPVRGLVALSMRPLPGQNREQLRALVAQAPVPVLEVFAERDLPVVLQGVDDRRRLAAQPNSGNTGSAADPARYRQLLIEGADADYSGQTDVLAKRIRGWMRMHIDR